MSKGLTPVEQKKADAIVAGLAPHLPTPPSGKEQNKEIEEAREAKQLKMLERLVWDCCGPRPKDSNSKNLEIIAVTLKTIPEKKKRDDLRKHLISYAEELTLNTDPASKNFGLGRGVEFNIQLQAAESKLQNQQQSAQRWAGSPG